MLDLPGKLEDTVFPDRDAKSEPNDQPQLGPAHFDPLEESSGEHAAVPGVFLGGTSTVQIVCYCLSLVGPYDELLMMPGTFALPAELSQAPMPRVTRIWVSTLQAVFNGRKNWNKPKHVAHFEFASSSSGAIVVSVYALKSHTFTQLSKAEEARFEPVFSSIPFFCTTITPLGPESVRLPIRFSTLPSAPTHLAQPPLEEGDPALGLTGTKAWKKFKIDVTGRVALCRAVGGLETPICSCLHLTLF